MKKGIAEVSGNQISCFPKGANTNPIAFVKGVAHAFHHGEIWQDNVERLLTGPCLSIYRKTLVFTGPFALGPISFPVVFVIEHGLLGQSYALMLSPM